MRIHIRNKPSGNVTEQYRLVLCWLRYNCGLAFKLDLVLPTDGSFKENIKKEKEKEKRKKERNRSQSQCLILIMLIQIYGLFSLKHDWLSLVSKTMQGYSEFLFIYWVERNGLICKGVECNEVKNHCIARVGRVGKKIPTRDFHLPSKLIKK